MSWGAGFDRTGAPVSWNHGMNTPDKRLGRRMHLERIGAALSANDHAVQKKLPTVAVFFALVALFMTVRWPFAWTANEENYFQLGHRLVVPGDYDRLHAVFDASSARSVGLALFGVISELLGFEWAHRVLGLGVTVAMSAGVAYVASGLRLTLFPTIGAVLLFLACRQSVVGGEWFIGSIEPKGFAYALGLLGFGAAIRRHVVLSAIMVASAGYFHFQVGLLWSLFTCVFFLAGTTSARTEALRFVSLVGFVSIPLIVLIAQDALAYAAFTPAPGFPTPDTIYSLIRAPHHVAPFAAVGGWENDAIAASILSLGIIAVACAGARQSRSEQLSRFLTALAIVAILLPFAVLMSWADRSSAWIGKFYPFRVASPLLLLTLLGWAALLDELGSNAQKRLAWGIAIMGSLIQIAVTRSAFVSPPRDRSWSDVIEATRRATEPGEAVLIDPAFDGMTSNSLPRLLERPTVVSWKFVPTAPSDIQRWYRLIKWRDRTIRQGCAGRARVGAMILTPETARGMMPCSLVIYLDARAAVVDLKSS